MKEKVLELLADKEMRPEEKYNEAMALYRRSEGHSVPASNFYNRAGFSKQNLKNICYDLQKLYGINDATIRDAQIKVLNVKTETSLSEALVKAIQDSKDETKLLIVVGAKYGDAIDTLDVANSDEINALFEGGKEFFEEHQELLKEHRHIDENELKSLMLDVVGDVDIPKGIIELLAPVQRDVDLRKFVSDIPSEAGEGLKLREEFTFLGDENCPDKFKILVADRITAWKKYKESHAELLKVANGESEELLSDKELYVLAEKAINSFELNQDIWDELNHYNEHGEILGKHPIFTDEALKAKVNGYSVSQLAQKKGSLRSYISKNKKKLEGAKTEDSKAKIQAKIDAWADELKLVEARLEEK